MATQPLAPKGSKPETDKDMLQGINSPLIPAQPDKNGRLSVWTALGVSLQLALEQTDLNSRSVGDWIARLQPALEAGQCHILLDDEHRPFGFASWIATDLTQHRQWLWGESLQLSDWREGAADEKELYLWIVDFVVPFGHQLQALQHLKALLPGYNGAWTFTPHAEAEGEVAGQMPPRRLW